MYEERITLWRTASMDEAIEHAEAKAREYAADVSTPPADPTEYVGLPQAYLLSDSPGHGAEAVESIRAPCGCFAAARSRPAPR